jgi:hypothetical protein
MPFRIHGLLPEPFAGLFDLSDEELAQRRAVRVMADANPGFPCRVSLQDAEPGEELLLVNHLYQPADSPYRGSHAIYVRKSASEAAMIEDRLPPALESRLLSLRAFDAKGMMLDGEVAEGEAAIPVIERFLALPGAETVHIHSARRGCYLARAVLAVTSTPS